MRRLSFLLLLAATPAAADIHPRYHEAYKAAAANVVVLSVDRFGASGVRRDGMGDCTLEGRVEAVERGGRFTPGQAMTVTVPCFTARAQLPSSGIQWQPVEQLRGATRGRVWLNAEGAQLDQRYFQILP